jgi:hypothetical protein
MREDWAFLAAEDDVPNLPNGNPDTWPASEEPE